MTLFLCTEDDVGREECLNCGGSRTLGGTVEPVDGKYCSDECYEEAEEFLERMADQRHRDRIACSGCAATRVDLNEDGTCYCWGDRDDRRVVEL